MIIATTVMKYHIELFCTVEQWQIFCDSSFGIDKHDFCNGYGNAEFDEISGLLCFSKQYEYQEAKQLQSEILAIIGEKND